MKKQKTMKKSPSRKAANKLVSCSAKHRASEKRGVEAKSDTSQKRPHKHVFISYSTKDASEFATRLRRDLKNGSPAFEVWQDTKNIPPGVHWDEHVQKAIEESYCFIFVVSSKSVASDECLDEFAHARDCNIPIIPVVHHANAEKNIPFRMARVQRIDLSNYNESAVDRLRNALRPFLPRPDEQPPFDREQHVRWWSTEAQKSLDDGLVWTRQAIAKCLPEKADIVASIQALVSRIEAGNNQENAQLYLDDDQYSQLYLELAKKIRDLCDKCSSDKARWCRAMPPYDLLLLFKRLPHLDAKESTKDLKKAVSATAESSTQHPVSDVPLQGN